MLVGFARGVPVRLERQHHQARGAAQTAHGLEQARRLGGFGAGVGVIDAVHDQDRLVDLVGVEEARGLVVGLGRGPERTPLVLEPERGQGLVVATARGHAGAEEVGVRQQVRRHQRAVAVAGHANALGIDHAQLHGLGNGGLGIGDELFEIGVVGVLRIAHDREGGAVDDGVAGQQQQAIARQAGEGLFGTAHLSGLRGIGEIHRIGVEDGRYARTLDVAGRGVEGEGKRHAVLAGVGDQALLDLAHFRGRIGETRDGFDRGRERGFAGSGIGQRGTECAAERIGRIDRRLAPGQQAARFRGEPEQALVGIRRAAEQPLGLAAAEVIAVQKGAIALRRGPRSGQENRPVLLSQHAGSVGQGAALRIARMGVAFVHREIPEHAGGAARLVDVHQRNR